MMDLASLGLGMPADQHRAAPARHVDGRLAERAGQALSAAVALEALHGVQQRLALPHVTPIHQADTHQILERRELRRHARHPFLQGGTRKRESGPAREGEDPEQRVSMGHTDRSDDHEVLMTDRLDHPRLRRPLHQRSPFRDVEVRGRWALRGPISRLQGITLLVPVPVDRFLGSGDIAKVREQERQQVPVMVHLVGLELPALLAPQGRGADGPLTVRVFDQRHSELVESRPSPLEIGAQSTAPPGRRTGQPERDSSDGEGCGEQHGRRRRGFG
jgi:hypothetical protein